MKNRFIFGLAFITSFLTGAGVLSAADIRLSSPDEQPNSLETDDEGRYPAAGPIHVNHVDVDLEIDQLAPNVYAFVSNNTTHDWEDGNTTVIIGDDGVAVVDAPSTYLSKRHLAQIRKLTDKPIRYVINTHFHRDHVMGNHVYRDAFPDVTVIQQESTATLPIGGTRWLSKTFGGRPATTSYAQSDLIANSCRYTARLRRHAMCRQI